MDYAEVITRVIRDARIPMGSTYRGTDVLLGILDDAMGELVTELLKVGGHYLTTVVDLPIVGGRSKYRLPARHLRGEHVQRLDTQRKPQRSFAQAQPTDVADLEGTRGTPRKWYFEGSSVVVLPTPSQSGGFIRIRFSRRPSRAAMPGTYGSWTIAAMNPDETLLLLTTSEAPGVGELVDVIRGTSGFESIADDRAVLDVTGTPGNWSVRLDGEWQESPQGGDFIAIQGTTPVPQLPLEYHPVLVQYGVAQVQKEMRQYDAANETRKKASGMLITARDTLSPRTRDPGPIVQRDW